MKLQTILDAEKADFNISYKDSLCFLGSCFGENISSVFSQRKFKTLSNPFGIVFNPISIFDNIEQCLNNKVYSSQDIVLQNEVYSCFDFHSDVSALKYDEILNSINSKISETNMFLSETSVLFLTLGTAWVYEYETDKDEIKIAANCHKFPSSKFKKRLLEVEEIFLKATEVISKLKAVNNDLKIVFTISPVRHLKDGFVENNQSKSTLHLAVKKIVESNKNVTYFPAYEYIIDELRDYRFYSKDFVHPNELAVQYILAKFDKTYFDTKEIEIINKVESVNKALNHKVKFEKTEANQNFKVNLIKKIDELENLGFDFSEEKMKLLN